MASTLDDYIDSYLQGAEDYDLQVALHLKEIIPQTTHLDERILKEIIHELKQGMDAGKSFKVAFNEIYGEYILTGDSIEAELPELLTRIIVNVKLFLIYVSRKIGMEVEDLEKRIDSKNVERIIQLIGHLELAPHNVVFATFDEHNPENDPFLNHSVKDIIKMLGKDKMSFNKDEPLSVVKIRYRNEVDFEKKFPTFIDAGWYDRFYPSERDDKYGRTWCLDQTLDNMPEIVHKNLTISEVTEDIEFLED